MLEVGVHYSKNDLVSLLDQPSLATVRDGVYNCKNSTNYLLFVDLEKTVLAVCYAKTASTDKLSH